MSSLAGLEELAKQVKDLSLNDIAEKYPNCYPQTNPLDIYRAHLTNILYDITGVERKIIYSAIQWTNGLDKGDMIIAAPALRVKGRKPDELAKEWADKVMRES